MNNKTRFNLMYVLVAVFAVLFIHEVWTGMRALTTIPYSQFEELLKQNQVAEVAITDNEIRGTLSKPLENGLVQFRTVRVDDNLAETLSQYGVRFAGVVQESMLGDILGWVLPVLFFFGLYFLFMRWMMSRGGMGGQFMSIGKSKARVYVEKDTKTTFEDVAGVDEAKEELQEVVSYLKDPASYGRLGGKMPKGLLLVGPPGTGKTLLARAVAGEAGVPFFSISGSEFVEMFVGVGAARVRDLFEQARKSAPGIIFIDELDAIGRARGVSPGGGGNDEKEQTLNQLLVELDGFDASVGIVLIGATNRPEILDPALLRAGRFDRQVLVDRPDKTGRLDILRVHSEKVVMAPEVAMEQIAALTAGFTGADLANLVNEAALVATRRNASEVTLADFTTAIERIVAGLERKNRLLNEKERRVVAYHEMGHALVAAGLPGVDPVHKISIIPRGVGALGYTIQRPTEDRYLMTREELARKMAVLLGGRAAELLIFGHLSTGASDDISKVTDIARNMVTRYGMVEGLGSVAYEEEPRSFLGNIPAPREKRYSEETARRIDEAVLTLVNEAQETAGGVLNQHRDVLEESTRLLLEKETLDADDLRPFFERVASGAADETMDELRSRRNAVSA